MSVNSIRLEKVSKRYSQHWILKNIDLTFLPTAPYAIRGDNGSGKSTLLKMVSGFLSPSMGNITYTSEKDIIDRDEIFQHVSIWAPYVSLIRDLTIREMIQHFMLHKPLRNDVDYDSFIDILQLPLSPSTYIKSLSSGQEQRLGLALTVLADTDILLLDEPGSYLDEKSKLWMKKLIKENSKDRIVIIASNESADLTLCREECLISDFH